MTCEGSSAPLREMTRRCAWLASVAVALVACGGDTSTKPAQTPAPLEVPRLGDAGADLAPSAARPTPEEPGDSGTGDEDGRLGHASRQTLGIRAGALQVTGRLPPEVILRIVRQNFGRFRLCYEKALETDSNLAGHVTVRFVIDRTGAVKEAKEDSTDMPDKKLSACIVRAFDSFAFPAPEGGPVIVVFPVVLSVSWS